MKNKTLKYSISLAASWAWGVSLIVGMETVQQKGIIPFFIWAFANSIALPVFGLIAYKIPNLHKVVENKFIQSFMTIIMIFCLWIQLNSIKQTLENSNLFPEIWCNIIPIILTLLVMIVLYKNGLVRNILMDNPLWIICYILLIGLIIGGLIFQIDQNEIVSLANKSDLKWAFSTWPILLCGPIMNIQNWQMAEKLNKEKKMIAHSYAGIIFAVYMVLVFMFSFFKLNAVMNLLMVPIIMCITLSTIDASIVGMQKIGGRKIGLALSLLSIGFWPFLQKFGVLELWTFMGNARKYVACFCIIVSIFITLKEKKERQNAKYK